MIKPFCSLNILFYTMMINDYYAMCTCANGVKQLVCMCVCTYVSVARILASLIYLLNNDEFSRGKSASFLKFAAFGQTPELCRRRYATDFV